MHAVLLIRCADRPGIVAAVSTFLFRHGANVVDLDQHSTEEDPGTYFMRLELQTGGLDVPLPRLGELFAAEVAGPMGMEWRLASHADRRRVGVLVSRHDHALLDLLWNWRRGELRAEIPVVISNHPDLRGAVESFGVRFLHVPNDRDSRPAAEAAMIEALSGQVDVVVLARYMQILSAGFVDRFPGRIINIHHSFLPAFAGADPYRQAYDRGVKIVGATAHYVTAELDAGPIIDQDVARVSHRYSVEDLRSLGRDLERRVLFRAVRWHCEDRVLVHGNKTIVFA
ncbi:MAG: formyltetrahydrofolate deformylase [Anaeromyxobacteraceae bacterium]